MNAIVPKKVSSEPHSRQEINDATVLLFPDSTGIAPGGLAKDDGASQRVFDVQAALDRVEGNRELLGNMAGLFANQWRERLAEIARAGGRRDSAELEIIANRLKQSLRSFGAGKASRIAQELEELGRKRGFDAVGKKCDGLRVEIERLVNGLRELSGEIIPGRAR